ncbi:hypothetical protein PG993_015134 [Apiospora rasikravindrae]|uniref:Zn(2)-C6 fungal-type domain-containing protein n=1 Tax=Apiospora rasikravindrae TaxID=990691 RepID=A0ABR1RPS8_9PEZI
METNLLLRPLRPGGSAEATTSPASISNLSTKRQTCLQCRIRKVRCDGQPATCKNCQRLGFDCSFSQTVVNSAASISTARNGATGLQPPQRRRRTKACAHCRTRKTRCTGETPECSNCIRKGLVCMYSASASKQRQQATYATSSDSPGSSRLSRASLSPAAALAQHDSSVEEIVHQGGDGVLDPTTSASSSLTAAALDPTTLDELVEDYFAHLYPLSSYAFLHKPTVLQRCQDETIDAPLKLAICAITSLLLQHASYCHDLWAQQAEQLLMSPAAICRPSVFRLQALLLVIRYRIESGDFPAAFMLASLAARAAFALRLNYERSDAELVPLAQEARRRLFWSLFILDDFFSVGLREFELCPREIVYLQLPSDDDAFLAGRSCRTGSLEQPSMTTAADDSEGIGLRGAFLRLVSIRREIMRHIRRVALEELTAADTARSVRNFEQQLDALSSSLHPEQRYSAANLRTCKNKAQFVMAHASWHQCHCDLYRVYMPPGYTEAAPSSAVADLHPVKRGTMQRSCREHAESILQIVADFWNLKDLEHDATQPLLAERDVAVCAFESARIVLFCSSDASPPDDALVETALAKARLCLDMIKHHFAWSASVKTLRLKLERIINSYSARLALQHKEALNEPDPPEPQPTSRLSEFAKSRQKLSVQSLLLQSDFVDDSDEIAVSNPGSPLGQFTTTAAATAETTQPSYLAAAANDTLEIPVLTTSAPNPLPPPQQQQQPLGDFAADPTDFLSINGNTINSFDSGMSQGSGSDITDDGFVFNPWMGFAEDGNIYSGMGMSWGIDQEDY